MIDDDLILLDEHDEVDEQEDDGINHEPITPAVPHEPDEPNDTPTSTTKKPRRKRVSAAAKARDALMAAPKVPPCYGLIRALLSPSQRSMTDPMEVLQATHGNMQVLLKGRRVKLGHKPKAAITILLNKLHDWVFLQDDRINHIALVNELLGELIVMADVMNAMGLEPLEQWDTIETILDHWWVTDRVLKEHTETWAIVMCTARAIELQREEQTNEDTITP